MRSAAALARAVARGSLSARYNIGGCRFNSQAPAPSGATEILDEATNFEELTNPADMKPKDVVAALDKFIVGQKEAKRSVAIALRNRWRRHRVPSEFKEEIYPKNILMIGPTGVGKTEIARRVAKLTDAPFIRVECTKFTEVWALPLSPSPPLALVCLRSENKADGTVHSQALGMVWGRHTPRALAWPSLSAATNLIRTNRSGLHNAVVSRNNTSQA